MLRMDKQTGLAKTLVKSLKILEIHALVYPNWFLVNMYGFNIFFQAVQCCPLSHSHQVLFCTSSFPFLFSNSCSNKTPIRHRPPSHLQNPYSQRVQNVRKSKDRSEIRPPHHSLSIFRLRGRPENWTPLPDCRPCDKSKGPCRSLWFRAALERDQQEAEERFQEDVRFGVRLQGEIVLGWREMLEIEGWVRVEYLF